MTKKVTHAINEVPSPYVLENSENFSILLLINRNFIGVINKKNPVPYTPIYHVKKNQHAIHSCFTTFSTALRCKTFIERMDFTQKKHHAHATNANPTTHSVLENQNLPIETIKTSCFPDVSSFSVSIFKTHPRFKKKSAATSITTSRHQFCVRMSLNNVNNVYPSEKQHRQVQR